MMKVLSRLSAGFYIHHTRGFQSQLSVYNGLKETRAAARRIGKLHVAEFNPITMDLEDQLLSVSWPFSRQAIFSYFLEFFRFLASIANLR